MKGHSERGEWKRVTLRNCTLHVFVACGADGGACGNGLSGSDEREKGYAQ
jgi:hypothetical protein